MNKISKKGAQQIKLGKPEQERGIVWVCVCVWACVCVGMDARGEVFQAEETAGAKALRWECAPCAGGAAGKPGVGGG